jgi:hypothetical protein
LKLLSFSFQQFRNQSQVGLSVILMSNLEKGNRLEFLVRVTQHFLVSGICGQEAAIQIGERNANGRILKDRSPALLTLSQSLFRSPTLSTVRRRSATFRFVLIWLSTQHVVSSCGCSTD